MATLAAATNMPALALLGEDGELERSTEPFRRWYEDNAELCRASPELRRVLEGQAHAAVLKLDGVSVDIAAMADRAGGRHVLLTLPTGALPSLGDPGEALLDGALDESPALVWLKDLEGRYVRVNSRFTTLLGTSEERLLGRTDAEIPPAKTVDGPRAQDRPEGVEEPLQLEYMVGPFQGRDPFVVLRFPVADRQGTPTLVCGVAAPSSEAQVARSEAARLLRVERWSRLDADSVRAELLAEWGLLPDVRGAAAAPASAPIAGSAEQEAAVAEARAERATAVAERDTALAANEKLTVELEAAQAKLAELERALQAARADGEQGDAEAKLAEQAAELDRALARERERADELERTLGLVRQRLGDDAEAARAEVQRARADADAARTEVERARADANAARAELDAAVERERVHAEGLEQAQARVKNLEAELEAAVARADESRGDDSDAQLLAAEKVRAAAEAALADKEAALADAVAERDAALKARVVLEGQLEQERLQVVALRESCAAAEERIRDLAAGMERERVRAVGLEQAQARALEIEGELRTTAMRADKAELEVEQWRARVTNAESDLERARTQTHELEDKLGLAREQIDALEAEIKADRERVEAVQRELEAGRARVEELEGELEAGRARIDELEAKVETLGSEPALAVDEAAEPQPATDQPTISAAAELATVEDAEQVRPGATTGVSWQPTAKRNLSASLARESVWRNVLKETVQVLGSEGGWDTVTAWLPGDANDLGCAAIWTAHRGLDRFEALTVEGQIGRDGSLLDQALQAPHLTWLTDLDAVDDERLQTAAAHGMNSALLLPIRTGSTTIGLLELLTHDTVEPDAQIALSLEASALQLGRFGHLLSLGSK